MKKFFSKSKGESGQISFSIDDETTENIEESEGSNSCDEVNRVETFYTSPELSALKNHSSLSVDSSPKSLSSHSSPNISASSSPSISSPKTLPSTPDSLSISSILQKSHSSTIEKRNKKDQRKSTQLLANGSNASHETLQIPNSASSPRLSSDEFPRKSSYLLRRPSREKFFTLKRPSRITQSPEIATNSNSNTIQSFCKELIALEKEYVFHLKVLSTHYAEPLKNQNILPPQTISSIFLDVGILYEYHSKVLEKLNVSLFNNGQGLKIFFQDLIEKMGSYYAKYITSLSTSIYSIHDCFEKYPKFFPFIEKIRKSKECVGTSLPEFLLYVPKQLRSYISFLKNFLKNSSMGVFPEWSGLSDILKELETFSSEVILDKKLKEAQTILQLLSLEQSLIIPETEKFELILPSRVLIKQGDLVYVDRVNERHNVVGFLFNDIFLFAKVQEFGVKRASSLFTFSPPRNRSNSVLGIKTNLSPPTLEVRKKSMTNIVYKLMGKIELRNAVSCGIAPDNADTAFQIIVPQEYDYIFEAQNLIQKNEWVEELDKVLASLVLKSGGKSLRINSKLNEREWQLLLTNATETVYKKGQVILKEGTSNDRLFLLKKGKVKITKNFSLKEVTLFSMQDEGFFGEESFFGHSHVSVSVEAESGHVKVAEIETSFITNLFRLQPLIAMKFYRNLAFHSVHRLKNFPSAFKLVGDIKNEGIVRFNTQAKSGINYLLEEGFLKTPKEVAHFLKNTPELDKTQIGEYIGKKDSFNIEVLKAFVDTFSFKGLHIDLALRKFLGSFWLPGEAQVIDRIVEKFAEKYQLENSDIFKDRDSVYVLSFSIIMLATDLHNPNVKNRMTQADWLKNNRGTNSGQDYDKDFLLAIYERISLEKFKLTTDSEEIVEPQNEEIENQKIALNDQFQAKFNLFHDSVFIKAYPCLWKRIGKLYIFTKNVCYYSKVFGTKEKHVLTFCFITKIAKEKSTEIIFEEQSKKQSFTYMFPSPEERDEVFDLVYNIWENCTKLAFDTQTSGRLLVPEKKSNPKDINTDLPTEEDWNLLLKRAELLNFSKNASILNEGDSGQRIYQIIKGSVRIEKQIFRRTSYIATLTEQQLVQDEAKIRSLFNQFDSFKTGTINIFEFSSLTHLLDESIISSECEKIFAEIDSEKKGVIRFDQFFDWWKKFNFDENTNNQDSENQMKKKIDYDKLQLLLSSSQLRTSSKIVGRLGAGEIFGEMSFIQGEGASASVIADSEVELYRIEGHVLNTLFEWKPSLGAKFFKYLCMVIEKRIQARETQMREDDRVLSREQGNFLPDLQKATSRNVQAHSQALFEDTT